MQPSDTEQDQTKEVIYLKTVLPLPMDVHQEVYRLKQQSKDQRHCLILDYKNSPIKGTPFLTASANSAEHSVLDLTDVTEEEYQQLIYSWMKHLARVPFEELASEVAQIILYTVGYRHDNMPIAGPLLTDQFIEGFIQKHREIVARWITFLDSTILYLATCFCEQQELESRYETIRASMDTITDRAFVGVNVYRLFHIRGFSEHYYATLRADTPLFWFEKQFEKKMFGAEALAPLIIHENNTLAGILTAYMNNYPILEEVSTDGLVSG